MSETKEFSTAAIASISTGVLFSKFSEMHEVAEYLMGSTIWTHQFADEKLYAVLKKAILKQYPEMPTILENVTKDNYRERLAEIENKFDKVLSICAGELRKDPAA
jgi:hypothetical protein